MRAQRGEDRVRIGEKVRVGGIERIQHNLQ
jgi:hypothetical protein